MRVSASIMAHPDREPYVMDLLSVLDHDVPVHWDPEGPPSGSGDRVWRVARAAWQLYDPGADYHVMLQDDAVPCPDFLAGMERALDHVPDDALVIPYLGQGKNVPRRWADMAARADAVGASWVRSHTMMWGVCAAVPTRFVSDMVAWCDTKAGMPDDMRVGRWFQRRHIDTWYTWPSLIDHRLVPSITKHRQVERTARRHHRRSALMLDWTGPTIFDPMIARARGLRSGPHNRRRRVGVRV